MRLKQVKAEVDLQALKKEIAQHREEGNKLISHHKKMLEYYSDWEDKLVAIDKKIEQAMSDHGLSRQEVEEYDALADAFK